jgi:hypothetical protein
LLSFFCVGGESESGIASRDSGNILGVDLVQFISKVWKEDGLLAL